MIRINGWSKIKTGIASFRASALLRVNIKLIPSKHANKILLKSINFALVLEHFDNMVLLLLACDSSSRCILVDCLHLYSISSDTSSIERCRPIRISISISTSTESCLASISSCSGWFSTRLLSCRSSSLSELLLKRLNLSGLSTVLSILSLELLSDSSDLRLLFRDSFLQRTQISSHSWNISLITACLFDLGFKAWNWAL